MRLSLHGEYVCIPNEYKQIDGVQGLPQNAVALACRTPSADCSIVVSPLLFEQALPTTERELVLGIRSCLSDKQGLMHVGITKPFVYSIVKTLQEPTGIQYLLTIQKFCQHFIIEVAGTFTEYGLTGMRESVVMAKCIERGTVGTPTNPFEGWAWDPYYESDGNICPLMMNQAELEKYDSYFPQSPLSMCRALVDTVLEDI